MINYFKKKKISDRAEDEALYEYVMEEMNESSDLSKGIWAKAVAHSEGDEKRAKSLYMQYRVQSIKDEFETLKMAYNELSREQLFQTIKGGFKDLKEKIKKKEESETIEEAEKYKKIGGFLYFFGVLLVIGVLASIGNISTYFGEEYKATMSDLYLYQADDSIASSLNQIVFIEIMFAAFLIVFAIAFFNKSQHTKKIGIYWFSANLIITPYLFYLMNIISPDGTLGLLQGKLFGASFWSLIFLIYIVISKRVKRTFIKELLSLDEKAVVLVISMIFASTAYVFNDNINDISSPYTLGNAAEKLGNKNYDDENFREAIDWYQKSVNWGHSSSSFKLADSHYQLGDNSYAIKYYLEYLEYSQYEGAMYNLALAYKNDRNDYEAEIWFKKAFDIYLEKSNKGNKEAMKTLEYMYRYGRGVEKNTRTADEWKIKLDTAEGN